jgi:hypothetical protein
VRITVEVRNGGEELRIEVKVRSGVRNGGEE